MCLIAKLYSSRQLQLHLNWDSLKITCCYPFFGNLTRCELEYFKNLISDSHLQLSKQLEALDSFWSCLNFFGHLYILKLSYVLCRLYFWDYLHFLRSSLFIWVISFSFLSFSSFIKKLSSFFEVVWGHLHCVVGGSTNKLLCVCIW